MKRIRTALLCVVGAVSIILGIIMFTKDDGAWERSETYGGDAYTGIQNAAAQTANNVQALARIARFGFGSVLTVGGAAMVVCGIPTKEKMQVAIVESHDELSSTEQSTEE